MATFIAVAFAVIACIIVFMIAAAVTHVLMNMEREDNESVFILIAIPLLMAATALFALIALISFTIF